MMMRIYVKILIIYSALLFTQNVEKDNVNKFLDNIREVLNKILTSQPLVNRQTKQNRNQLKTKIRKQTIKKLATPFIRQPEHSIINTQKNSSNDQRNKLQANGESQSNTYYKTAYMKIIKELIRKNPVIMPPTLSDLKKILNRKLSKWGKEGIPTTTIHGENTSILITTEYIKALEEWYIEIITRIYNFWYLFYKNFKADGKKFDFLNNILCPGEIFPGGNIYPHGFEYPNAMDGALTLEEEFKYTSAVNFNNISEKIFQLYARARRPLRNYSPDYEETICYNIGKFAWYIDSIKLSDNLKVIFKCLAAWKKMDPQIIKDNCQNINENVRKTIYGVRKFFKYAKEITENYIIPAVITMCTQGCVCGDDIKCSTGLLNQQEDTVNTIPAVLFYITKAEIEETSEDYNEFLRKFSWYIEKKLSFEASPQCSGEKKIWDKVLKSINVIEDLQYFRHFIAQKDLVEFLIKIKEKEKTISEINKLFTMYQELLERRNKIRIGIVESIVKFLTETTLPICSYYFYSHFFRTIGDTIKKDWLRFDKLIMHLSAEKKRVYLAYYLNEIINDITKWASRDAFVFAGVDYVIVGRNFLKNVLTNSSEILFLPLLDYLMYFHNINYKASYCSERKTLFSYAISRKYIYEVFKCAFVEKEMRRCIIDGLKSDFNAGEKIAEVVNDFFEYAKISYIQLNQIDEVIDKIDRAITKKKYTEFLPKTVGKCCELLQQKANDKLIEEKCLPSDYLFEASNLLKCDEGFELSLKSIREEFEKKLKAAAGEELFNFLRKEMINSITPADKIDCLK